MKISYENKELIRHIQDICLRINQYTDYVAFYHFSGHVNGFDIRVCKSKEDYNNRIYAKELYTNLFEDDELYNELSEILETLQGYENGSKEVQVSETSI